MSSPTETCWTLIHAAARGGDVERDEFARRYMPAVEAYLAARWRGTRYLQERDDGVQEIFVEFFRQGGALSGVKQEHAGGFRAFLYGVARNVSLRIEKRRARNRERQPHTAMNLDDRGRDDEMSLSRAFDRSWALSVLNEAFERMSTTARVTGATTRRVELLRLRFDEGLPIRDIAKRWGTDPAALHEQYRLARQDFKKALLEVVSFYQPRSTAAVEEECAEILSMVRGE